LPLPLKRLVWEFKYEFGRYPHWNCADDVMQHLKACLPRTGNLLDLGCGSPSLLHSLRQCGWLGHYCGVDISSIVLRAGRELGDRNTRWVASAIETFDPAPAWDAIAFIESLYYVNVHKVPALLRRLAAKLNPAGFLLIRLHSPKKYAAYVQMIRDVPGAKQVGEKLFCIPRLASDPYPLPDGS
jgi:trans-aconitate methyltransferase